MPYSQKWALATDGSITTLENVAGAATNASCVAGAPRGVSNVWGRRLIDKSWAVVLANFNRTAAATVTCDSACLALMGWAPSQSLSVRDLWTHTENGTVSGASGGISVALAANGASVIVKLTPVSTE